MENFFNVHSMVGTTVTLLFAHEKHAVRDCQICCFWQERLPLVGHSLSETSVSLPLTLVPVPRKPHLTVVWCSCPLFLTNLVFQWFDIPAACSSPILSFSGLILLSQFVTKLVLQWSDILVSVLHQPCHLVVWYYCFRSSPSLSYSGLILLSLVPNQPCLSVVWYFWPHSSPSLSYSDLIILFLVPHQACVTVVWCSSFKSRSASRHSVLAVNGSVLHQSCLVAVQSFVVRRVCRSHAFIVQTTQRRRCTSRRWQSQLTHDTSLMNTLWKLLLSLINTTIFIITNSANDSQANRV